MAATFLELLLQPEIVVVHAFGTPHTVYVSTMALSPH